MSNWKEALTLVCEKTTRLYQSWALADFFCGPAHLRTSGSQIWARSAHGNNGLNIMLAPESGLG